MDPAAASRIRQLWCEVLDRDSVELTDNFFVLGGRSLTAMMVAAKVQETCQLSVSIADVFREPVLRDFIALAQARANEP